MSIIYCTYLTIYFGNKLPPFYIGSSSIKAINNGYKGSVKSKKYKTIWKSELKKNFHLFRTKIITKHYNRQEAINKEYKLQKQLNVIKNNLYINQSMAAPNGFFGMDVSGKNNPMYGIHLHNIHSEETKNKIGEANKGNKAFLGKKHSKKSKEKMKNARLLNNHRKGTHKSEDWKKLHSEKLKGRKQTDEQIRKRVLSRKLTLEKKNQILNSLSS